MSGVPVAGAVAGQRTGAGTGAGGRAAEKDASPGTPASASWTAVLPVVAPAVCAGLAFHRVYGLRPIALVVLAAVLTAVVAPAAGAARAAARGSGPVALAATFTGAAVPTGLAGWLLLYRSSAPTPALAWRAFGDLVDAPHRVLTLVPPVQDNGSLVVLPFAAAGLGAYASAELAVRTRAVLAPVVPLLAVFGLGVALGAGAPGGNSATAVAFAAGCGVLVVARAPGHGGRGGRPVARGGAGRARTAALAGVPLVAAQAVVAGLVGPGVGGVGDRAPVSLRDSVPLPDTVRVTSGSPLDMVSAWLQDPFRPLFQVWASDEAAVSPDVERLWRLTVLTRFDGATWYPAERLRPTDGSIAAPSADRVRTIALDQRVTVQELPGVWLPAADRPEHIVGPASVEVAVDPDSGAVAATTPLRPGDTYQVQSHVPVLDVSGVEYAPTTDDPTTTGLPDAPDLRDDLREQAQLATEGASFPYQQALRLARWLREGGTVDAEVTGHTYRHVRQLLADKRGTAEQFATAFAVLARELGLPTRLAVGFREGTRTADGTLQVSGGDVAVWPEVEFAGYGWVPFHPTPTALAGSGGAADADDPEAPPPPPDATAPQSAVERRAAEDSRIIATTHEPPVTVPSVGGGADDGGGARWWLWPLVAVAALLLVGAVRQLVRLVGGFLRHRAERRAGPALQVLAAWQGIVRALTRHGMPDPASRTPEEVGAYGRDLVAAASELPLLASLVNGIAYGGHDPDGAAAAEAWRQHDEIAKALRAEHRRRGGPASLVPAFLVPSLLAPSLHRHRSTDV